MAVAAPERDLHALWTAEYGRFSSSRALIETCAAWARGTVEPHVPANWQAPEKFRVTLPHAVTLGQDVAAFVGRKQPAPKRIPLGAGTKAAKAASTVEEWLQAVLLDYLQIDGDPLYEVLVSYATHDAEFGVLVSPRPAHYAHLLQFQDEDGQVVARWRRNREGETEGEFRAKRPRAEYRVDPGKSAEAYRAYERDAKARTLPFVVRVLSAAQCLPFGRDPRTGRLDALLIRTERTAISLQDDGFTFSAATDGQDGAGAGSTFVLYELWTPGKVRYQVTGLTGAAYHTHLNNEHAVIDLQAEYGLRTVPGGYYYGWHRAHETDPAKKGIPILSPFLGILRAANQIATAKLAHTHMTGFGAWGFKLDTELLGVWQEMGRPVSMDLEPMKNHVLLGEPRSLVHQGSGPEANEMMGLLLGLVDKFSQSNAIKGDPSNSGFGQAVSASSVETVLRQISEGATAALTCVATNLLEQVALLSEKTGSSIPVYTHVTRQGDVQTHLELGEDDLLGDFTVRISFPQKRGQNLPLAQAGTTWASGKFISRRTWLQDFYGDEQPEEEEDRIWVERWLDTPEVDAQVMELVALMQGDRAMRQKSKLQQEGTLSPGGTPSALLPERPAAPSLGPVPNTGNPAASAVAGIVGGPSMTQAQARVIAATGQPVDTAMP